MHSSLKVVVASFSHSDVLGKILPLTHGPTQLASVGDQPLDKNILFNKTF